MVRQHHCTNVHEFEQTLRDSEEQGSLVCCNPWGHKESDMTQQLNNNNINYLVNGAEANVISMENAFTLHSMKKKIHCKC